MDAGDLPSKVKEFLSLAFRPMVLNYSQPQSFGWGFLFATVIWAVDVFIIGV
jgi:hypothetical protein